MSRTASYDFLLVGAGLFNAVFANEATKEGKKCLVVEKRKHLGGNLYCRFMEGIQVHMYGLHIFHTNNPAVWNYVTGLTGFNHFINSPLARYGDKLYNLPFNMNTFYQLWNVTSPQEAREKIKGQKQTIKNPRNLEEQALPLINDKNTVQFDMFLIINTIRLAYIEYFSTFAINAFCHFFKIFIIIKELTSKSLRKINLADVEKSFPVLTKNEKRAILEHRQ